MRKLFFLFMFESLGIVLFAQKEYDSGFYPEYVLIDGVKQPADTIKARLMENTTNRIVVWENGCNKVSVLYKIKSTQGKFITKARTEVYKNGRWKKAPLRIYTKERRFLSITRWTSFSKTMEDPGSAILIIREISRDKVQVSFVGDKGELVEVKGYFECIK